jgi:hypothetical protein
LRLVVSVAIRLALLLASIFQPVTFFVTDARNGAPVYPVLVTTLASDHGRPLAIQKLVVTGPDQVVAVLRIGKILSLSSLSAGEFAVATRQIAALLPENPIALVRTVRLHGRIREAASGLPIAGARIQVLSGQQQINVRGLRAGSNGEFSTKCEPGRIRVSAWALGYSQAMTSVSAESGGELEVALDLKPAVVLRGQFPAFVPSPIDAFVEARPTGPPAMFAVRTKVRANRFELPNLSVGGSYEVLYSSGKCRSVRIAKLVKLAAADVALTLPFPACEAP